MVVGRITDALGRGADAALRGAEGVLGGVADAFDPTLRLGVTGLSRAGKTVFVTSLVANLIDRGRMPALSAAERIEAAFLQPQPDDAVPRFDYERNLAALTGPHPRWPDGTRAVSQLRLSFRTRTGGMLGGLRGARVLHLDVVDYPGEWLLDVSLLDLDYAAWSARALARLATWGDATFRAAAEAAAGEGAFSDTEATRLHEAYVAALHAARDAGAYDLTPGRFLLPGEMEGSPALTFAPLPHGPAPRGSLRREMARRFESYKARVARPFFRDHFARIDRQVVLLDLLGALSRGPRAVDEMREAMTDILRAFRPGAVGWLASLVGLRRVDRILFAATKVDHLHHAQHARLQALLEAMVAEARARADFAGARTGAMAIASLRATTEEDREGEEAAATGGLVRGRLEDGRAVATRPGVLPENPAEIMGAAASDAAAFADPWQVAALAPSPGTLRPGSGPPHVRLDRAAEFLIGDRL